MPTILTANTVEIKQTTRRDGEKGDISSLSQVILTSYAVLGNPTR